MKSDEWGLNNVKGKGNVRCTIFNLKISANLNVDIGSKRNCIS